MSLLVADRISRDQMLASPTNTSAPDNADTAAEAPAGGSDPYFFVMRWQLTGFALSLVAMSVPISQLMEQRCITPTYNLILKKSANPMVLLAAAYMIAASLPRQVSRLACD